MQRCDVNASLLLCAGCAWYHIGNLAMTGSPLTTSLTVAIVTGPSIIVRGRQSKQRLVSLVSLWQRDPSHALKMTDFIIHRSFHCPSPITCNFTSAT